MQTYTLKLDTLGTNDGEQLSALALALNFDTFHETMRRNSECTSEFREYLKGDQSGGGLLREAIDFLFSRYTRDAHAHYDVATDTITIEAEDRVITDYLIEKQGEDEMQACTLPAQDVIEKLLSDDLNSSKVLELAKRKQKREERIKEWETKKILNEEREAKKREERRARLEAMTK